MATLRGSSQARAPFRSMRDEELIALARAGSRPAAESLLLRYRSLVEGKARVFYLVGAEREDVLQEGMIGLYKAIRDYSPGGLSAFRSFAELCITRQIISALKTATRQKHQVFNRCSSLENRTGWESGEPLGEVLPDPRAVDPQQVVLARLRCRQVIGQMDRLLSDFEARALLGYLRGQSYRRLSRDLDCQVKQVDNALQRAKQKLNAHFACD